MLDDDVEEIARHLMERSGRNPDAYPRHGIHWRDARNTARAVIEVLQERDPAPRGTAWMADDSTLWRMSPEGRLEPVIRGVFRHRMSVDELEQHKQQRLREIKTLTRSPEHDDNIND